MSSNKPIARRTAEWLSQLQNEEKGKELLEQAVGTHQIIALDAEDLRKLLACGGKVITSEGAGHTCSEALNLARQSVQSWLHDITDAKAVLTSIIIQKKEIDMMEAVETVDGFFNNFHSQTKLTWGISLNPNQNSEYLIKLWIVTA